MTGVVINVVGGQFGSEGKGAVAARVALGLGRLAAVRVAGPNAGHSAVDAHGRKWALRQIPVVAVTNLDAVLVIGAGSEIDEEVLQSEVDTLDAAGFAVSQRLYVDGQATVIQPEHKQSETGLGGAGQGSLVDRIGSTGKGIGAARAARMMREAPLWCDGHDPDGDLRLPMWGIGTDTAAMLRRWLYNGDVLIEGTQGYGLGLHAGYYPQCTSSDCRAVDFMAMTGITPWDPLVTHIETWVVLRTYPIRVAGNSGPLLAETSWDDLNKATLGYIKEERTTVTQKVRRVGCWDPDLAKAAIEANGGRSAKIALTFFDYLYPELAGATSPTQLTGQHRATIAEMERDAGAAIAYLGTGPDSGVFL